MAEPALDLGRFRAKLRDIVISVLSASDQPMEGSALDWHLNLMDELCDHFLDAYCEKAKVSRERVLLWETCDLLTAMLHAWTKVRLLRIDSSDDRAEAPPRKALHAGVAVVAIDPVGGGSAD